MSRTTLLHCLVAAGALSLVPVTEAGTGPRQADPAPLELTFKISPDHVPVGGTIQLIYTLSHVGNASFKFTDQATAKTVGTATLHNVTGGTLKYRLRFRGKALRAGKYYVSMTAKDSAGNIPPPAAWEFTITKRR
jgi:hypothetical protein